MCQGLRKARSSQSSPAQFFRKEHQHTPLHTPHKAKGLVQARTLQWRPHTIDNRSLTVNTPGSLSIVDHPLPAISNVPEIDHELFNAKNSARAQTPEDAEVQVRRKGDVFARVASHFACATAFTDVGCCRPVSWLSDVFVLTRMVPFTLPRACACSLSPSVRACVVDAAGEKKR